MNARSGSLRRRGAVAVVVAVVAQLLVLFVASQPASAAPRRVANPGTFTLGANVGAFKIKNEIFGFEGGDADDITIAGNVQSDGTVNLTTVSFPAQQVDVPVLGSATVHIRPVFPMTGSLNPSTGELSLTVRAWIKIDAPFPVGGGCKIGSAGSPITIPLSTSEMAPALVADGYPAPRPYNPANGTAVVADNDFSVPGASDCGVANGTVNDQIGLPSAAGNNEVLIDGFTSTVFTPASFAFSASPTSPVVNKPVTLNATGTTTQHLVRFEFDPEGDGTFVNNGTNPVYVHPGYPSTGTRTARMRAVYSDGNNEERTATVMVTANTPPTATDRSIQTAEDTAVAVTLQGSDPNGDSLTFTVTDTPEHGSLSGSVPNLTYTPAADFNGVDTIGFSVSDGNGGSDTGTVTITVTPVNDAPVAQDGVLAVTEDVAQPVTLVATDVDGDALTYGITTAPSKGTVTCSPPGGPACTYTPHANANGADAFTFTASDGNGGADTGTISVSIASVNDAPTATDVVTSTDEDAPVNVTLGGTDPDGDALTATVTGLPAHGVLSGSPPNLTYTPNPNYHGADAFTFQVSDGKGGVDAGTVSITVTPVNDDPTAGTAAVTTPEDTPVPVQLTGNDIDGDTLTFAVADEPANGVVTCDPSGACTYTPNAGYAGPDSFTYTVDDGNGGTATGTVELTVAALQNDAPVFSTPANLVVLEDIARTIDVDAADADGDTVSYSVVTEPAHGTLTGSAPSTTYTPDTNFSGVDTLVVRASDGRGGITDHTITLTVIALNDAPAAVDQATSTPEGAPVDVGLVAVDPDDATLTWVVKVAPAHGAATIDGATLTYTPAAGFVGTDTVEVEAVDAAGARSRATITVEVIDVPQPPVAGTAAVSVPEDGSVALELPASDPDGGPLTVEVGEGTLGALSCTGTDCTYTPHPDASGTDTVPFAVADQDGETAQGSVVVTVIPAPDAPTATDATVPVPEGTPTVVTLAGTDADGEALVARITSAPSHGTVTGTAPEVTYRPQAGFVGTDSFTFEVEDPTGRTATGTITLVVQAVDHTPTATAQSLATAEDTPLAITLGGTDAEGAVTVSIVSDPSNGSLTGTAPNVTYVPAADFSGVDAFTFRVTDSAGQHAEALVTIQVAAANDRPVATGGNASTSRTVPVAIPLQATDADGDPLTYSLRSGPHHGSVVIDGATATYTPAGLFTGTDAFTFRATDPSGAFGSATVVVSVDAGADLATALAVEQGNVKRNLLNNRYSNLAATLSVPAAGDLPLQGETVTFRVAGRVICSATTDAAGRAVCGGNGPLLHGLGATTYTATFAGGPGLAGTSASGALR